MERVSVCGIGLFCVLILEYSVYRGIIISIDASGLHFNISTGALLKTWRGIVFGFLWSFHSDRSTMQ